jgi:hypothetical protein
VSNSGSSIIVLTSASIIRKFYMHLQAAFGRQQSAACKLYRILLDSLFHATSELAYLIILSNELTILVRLFNRSGLMEFFAKIKFTIPTPFASTPLNCHPQFSVKEHASLVPLN